MCPETVLAIGEHASELGKTFAMSFGNPKFCRLFKDSQLAAIRYVDFLFANKEVPLTYYFQIIISKKIMQKNAVK